MNVSKEDIKKEKCYLKEVITIIDRIIEQSSKSINYSKKDLNEIKRFMWENLTEYTDEERAIALNDVDYKVSQVNVRIDDLYKYEKAKSSPYFGKIVFKYKDANFFSPIYIGMKNIYEDNKIYVFDWRAPISSIFYNYELGPASFESPSGIIDGELLSKMQFKIDNGELIRCFNCEINIDDEYLQDILSNVSSNKMKNIVNTIQREQNKIIRNSSDRYLIVQGVAGSGKTSVALHRIAYLLYKDKNLKSNNVLIFSPNNVFSDYISNVLPELGEENGITTTLYDFAKSFLKANRIIESYSELLERMYSDECNEAITKDISYKLSSECKKDIDNFFKEYERKMCFSRGLNINEKYYSQLYLQKLFIDKYGKLSLKERINQMAEHICLTSAISVKRNLASVSKNLNAIFKIKYNHVSLYNSFLKSKGLKPVGKNKVNYEDIVGLIYVYFKLYGVPEYNYIRHVVIDEAQDYSEFQFDVLKMLFSNASFTILGDVYQTINPHYKYNSLEQLKNIFDNAIYLQLNKTYRSSEEIIEYSNKILELSNVSAIRNRINIPVGIKEVEYDEMVDTLRHDVDEMRKNGMNKVAIIVKNMTDAKKIANMLQLTENDEIQLVLSGSEVINKPIIIIPSYLSKGLEFDSVIVCNTNHKKYEEREKNLYYVVCTRAQHKLSVYNEPINILKRRTKGTKN